MNIDNVHRHKCMQDIEAAKLRQAVEEEINLRHSFRGKFYFQMSLHTCVLFLIDMQLPDLFFSLNEWHNIISVLFILLKNCQFLKLLSIN